MKMGAAQGFVAQVASSGLGIFCAQPHILAGADLSVYVCEFRIRNQTLMACGHADLKGKVCASRDSFAAPNNEKHGVDCPCVSISIENLRA